MAMMSVDGAAAVDAAAGTGLEAMEQRDPAATWPADQREKEMA
jgi:hypothetical protein